MIVASAETPDANDPSCSINDVSARMAVLDLNGNGKVDAESAIAMARAEAMRGRLSRRRPRSSDQPPKFTTSGTSAGAPGPGAYYVELGAPEVKDGTFSDGGRAKVLVNFTDIAVVTIPLKAIGSVPVEPTSELLSGSSPL